MPEFDYHQRPATPEYRENWERLYGHGHTSPPPPETYQPAEAFASLHRYVDELDAQQMGERPAITDGLDAFRGIRNALAIEAVAALLIGLLWWAV